MNQLLFGQQKCYVEHYDGKIMHLVLLAGPHGFPSFCLSELFGHVDINRMLAEPHGLPLFLDGFFLKTNRAFSLFFVCVL